MAKSLVTLLTPLGARYYNRRGKQSTYKRCVLSIEHLLEDARISFYFFCSLFSFVFSLYVYTAAVFSFSCFSRNRVLSFFDASRSFSCRFLLTAARFSPLSLSLWSGSTFLSSTIFMLRFGLYTLHVYSNEWQS